MKATLEFNLPDEEQLFRAAVNAEKAHLVIWNLVEFLRYKINRDENLSEEQEKVYQDLSDKLFELLEKYKVDQNEIE